ncbi:hypothetical protein P3T76_004900 [Phytophthora citrophthora]|uniref:Uncharacterized protein n=1 Tax=Phytophthora citrophthora TaxID=4793 RepID=A0AAD9GS06_9STRA|nr:hypothetical protein P3T76_004900 [Phytophthora citrophthora]
MGARSLITIKEWKTVALLKGVIKVKKHDTIKALAQAGNLKQLRFRVAKDKLNEVLDKNKKAKKSVGRTSFSYVSFREIDTNFVE